MNAQSIDLNRAKSTELAIRQAQQAGCICAIAELPLATPIGEQAQQHLATNCPYAFCFRDIQFEFAAGALTLRGRVASYYLKQVLQTSLRNLPVLEQIDNRVDVVSATGLSSEPGT